MDIKAELKKSKPRKSAAKKSKPRKTSAPKTDSVADEIKKFADLKDQGILTQEEFDAKKKEHLRCTVLLLALLKLFVREK